MARTTPLDRYRNIGIMAHIDAGKTTTTERILYYTGTILQDRRGARRHRDDGLDGAGAGARHHDHLRRDDLLLARPPHQHHRHARPRRLHDRGRALACACSTARSRCSTRVAGVEPQSETVWRQADKYGVPRICFVNKMDRIGADFYRCVADDHRPPRRQARWSSSCRSASRAISSAWSTWSRMKAHRSGRTRRSGAEFDDRRDPGRYEGEGRGVSPRAASRLAVELDDAALEAYLDGKEPDAETLKRCIRKGTITGAFVPVLCGSAFKNKGVQPLLDAVVDYPAGADRRRRRQRHQARQRRGSDAASARTTSRSPALPSRS